MQAGFYLSALLLGMAGGLHCVAMCGAVGGALCGGARRPAFRLWNGLRLLSYCITGAMVGGGAAALAALSGRHPAVQAVWVLLQVTSLTVALLMLLMPRRAGWAVLAGQAGWLPVRWDVAGTATASVVRLPSRRLAGRWGALTGLFWGGFPCGLLHGALLMAWMSGSAVDGAFVMCLFGLASMAWLLAGVRVADGVRRRMGWSEERMLRLTGAVLLATWLVLASGWAGGQGPWVQAGIFCSTRQ